MYELTSENDGATYFNCTLQINEENLAMNGFEIGVDKTLESDYPYSLLGKY